ncbi:MAG: hypothetical protein HUU46_01305 [Candidatus Hydrogenedentes bacterium]|nr:hypothetical protein [Candidatus Hydrogenedentota bacterium]
MQQFRSGGKAVNVDDVQVIDRAALQRLNGKGVYTVCLTRTACNEYHVTAPASRDEHPGAVFERAAEALRDTGAAIVSMDVAGVPFDAGRGEMIRAFGTPSWPVTWIDRRPFHAGGGLHIWAVSGPVLTPIENGDVVAAVRFEDLWATYCCAGGFLPAGIAAPPADKTLSVLTAMESTLESANLEFADVVRTWFYNRDITAWYREFNRARTQFFDSRGVFDRLVPASTGVGAGDIGTAALTGGLLAIRPKNGFVQISAVDSPLQCPATKYGSAFSRAVEAAFPDHGRLYVSGTASISRDGHTQHLGDIVAQVERTIGVVGALLESRVMSWDDVTSGTAYIKRGEDFAAVAKCLERAKIDAAPFLMLQADICRDELLFELEVSAISTRIENNHHSD